MEGLCRDQRMLMQLRMKRMFDTRMTAAKRRGNSRDRPFPTKRICGENENGALRLFGHSADAELISGPNRDFAVPIDLEHFFAADGPALFVRQAGHDLF